MPQKLLVMQEDKTTCKKMRERENIEHQMFIRADQQNQFYILK